MSARTELIALLACCVPLNVARDMVDRHHAEVASSLQQRVAVLEMAIGTARAMHRKHSDSEHCQYDGMEWPCPNVLVLDGTVSELAAAVDVMGALPMPTGAPEPSPWERAVAGLNALADAKVPFSIEPDGHIANPFGDEHIEWDQEASRWRLVHDDEDDTPAPGALAEQRHLVDELDHVLEHLADDRPTVVLPAQRDRGTGL